MAVSHSERGWSLLCNGVILFGDLGEPLPDGRAASSRSPAEERVPAAAREGECDGQGSADPHP
ncbi:DUF5999 family protein [Streptomyces sp. NBC_00829]|uniref:DUF5999 family protein n=1 Tax=Streptomyces sp. NBC_00829 TaxID=2903679 RepID=UPI0038663918|nr:DUF5999 family protein [Streptomyces sp. NBC_00829]